jgi:ABC-2 type transport system permease protein
MSRLVLIFWNPIVAKEYRSRMRTWRSPVALMVYILLLGGLGWAVFAAISYSSTYNYSGGSANYGQSLFTYLVIFQMLLVAFITPALTAGAISGERERQTIDLLFVTLIRPFSIIWGKLLASISFILLLLLISVPIFSLVFLFGGIEFDQVFEAFLVTSVTALTLGAIGIAFSTWLRRTLPATVAAYGAAFLLLAGTLVYGLLFPTDADPRSATLPAPPVVTYIGPIIPLLTIATEAPVFGNYGVRGSTVSNGAGVSCSGSSNGAQTCFPTTANGQVAFSQAPTSGTSITSGPFRGWQYWQASIAMQLGICLLALLLSALALPPVRRFGRFRSRTTDQRREAPPTSKT